MLLLPLQRLYMVIFKGHLWARPTNRVSSWKFTKNQLPLWRLSNNLAFLPQSLGFGMWRGMKMVVGDSWPGKNNKTLCNYPAFSTPQIGHSLCDPSLQAFSPVIYALEAGIMLRTENMDKSRQVEELNYGVTLKARTYLAKVTRDEAFAGQELLSNSRTRKRSVWIDNWISSALISCIKFSSQILLALKNDPILIFEIIIQINSFPFLHSKWRV